jgi:SagB-type dehydrogenase family enzyme
MQQGRGPYPAGPVETADPPAAAPQTVLTRDAWDRMTLAPLAAGPEPSALVPAAAADALALIDLGFTETRQTGAAGCRAVPSAGGIYPYEFYIVTAEACGPGVFHADPLRHRVCRLPAPEHASDLLRRSGLDLPAPGGALIVIVARPWLSMRKYGDRGYLYTQMDAAHLAANLLGVAARRAGADLRLRFEREPVTRLIGAHDSCREVHSVLRIEPASASAAPTGTGPREDPPEWRAHGSGPERPSWLERMCWESIRPLLARDPAGPPAPGRHPLVPAGGRFPHEGARDPADRWPELSRARRSSKGFRPGSVPAEDLARALAALRTPLAVDLPPGPGLEITLLARSVAGLAPGAYPITEHAYAPTTTPTAVSNGSAPAPAAAHPVADRDIVESCMRQEHLGPAAAAVLFHAAHDRIVGRPPAAVRELMFRAGALGQLLYLGARAHGVGVTAVGGFDSARWRDLARLDGREEPLYLVLLGLDDGPGTKWDSLQTAYPQRER